jgi:WD40 repeat protein
MSELTPYQPPLPPELGEVQAALERWQSRFEYRLRAGHSSWVCAVAVDSARGIVAGGSWNWTVKLWDLATGKELRTLAGHTDEVVCAVAVGGTRGIVAGGSKDQTVRLWDLAAGHELRTLAGHKSRVGSVAIDAARGIVASDSVDGTVKLWNLATGQEWRTLKGHTAPIASLAIWPEPDLVISGSADGTIRLWSLTEGKFLAALVSLGQQGWMTVLHDGYCDASSEALVDEVNLATADGTAELQDQLVFDPKRVKAALAEIRRGARPSRIRRTPPSNTLEANPRITGRHCRTAAPVGRRE